MATKRSTPRRDFTQVALDVVQRATGEAYTTHSSPKKQAAPEVASGATKKVARKPSKAP